MSHDKTIHTAIFVRVRGLRIVEQAFVYNVVEGYSK